MNICVYEYILCVRDEYCRGGSKTSPIPNYLLWHNDLCVIFTYTQRVIHGYEHTHTYLTSKTVAELDIRKTATSAANVGFAVFVAL